MSSHLASKIIVASFTTGDEKRLEKEFRKWKRSKFPEQLKSQTEIKFNDAHIDEEL